jgi:hypothetical protein
MSRWKADTETMGTVEIIVRDPRRKELVFRRIQFGHEEKLIHRDSTCGSWGEHGDVISDDQISGKDLTSLKSSATDIESDTPCELFVNSKAEQRIESNSQDFRR